MFMRGILLSAHGRRSLDDRGGVLGVVLADRVPKPFPPLRLCRHYTVMKSNADLRRDVHVGLFTKVKLVHLCDNTSKAGAARLVVLGVYWKPVRHVLEG